MSPAEISRLERLERRLFGEDGDGNDGAFGKVSEEIGKVAERVRAIEDRFTAIDAVSAMTEKREVKQARMWGLIGSLIGAGVFFLVQLLHGQ